MSNQPMGAHEARKRVHRLSSPNSCEACRLRAAEEIVAGHYADLMTGPSQIQAKILVARYVGRTRPKHITLRCYEQGHRYIEATEVADAGA